MRIHVVAAVLVTVAGFYFKIRALEWGMIVLCICSVIAMELIHKGIWQPDGVNGPEWFDAKPFLDLLEEYDSSWHIREESTDGIVPDDAASIA